MLTLLLRRVVSERVFVALRLVGLLLAVAIASGVFIYLDALRQAALDDTLSRAPRADLDVAIRARASEPSPAEHDRLRSAVAATVSGAALGAIAGDPIAAVRSPTLLFDSDEVPWANARTFLASVEGLPAASRLVGGAWPVAGTAPIQVALSADDATYLGAGVGDTFRLSAPAASGDTISVRVSGIYSAVAPDALVWRAYHDGLGTESRAFRNAPMIVAEETLRSGIAGLLPDAGLRYYWLLPTVSDRVRARDAEAILAALSEQDASLRVVLQGFQRITRLDELLSGHIAEAAISVELLLAVGAVIAAAALALTVLVAARARELRASESSTMRARGATARQELLLMAGESISVAAVATIVGPLAAREFVRLAGRLPGLAGLTDGMSDLPAALTWPALVASGVVGAIGVLAMMLPSLTRSSQAVVQRLARPPQLTVLQRYYLDVPILGVALFAAWQLGQGDLRLASDVLGSGFSSQLAFAMPAAIAVGVALVVLRFVPLAMSALGSVVGRAQSALRVSPAVTIALWSMARNPGANFGLMLLVILAISIATLGAVLAPSVQGHAAESARYLVGADARISGMIVRSQSTLARQVELARGGAGIEAVSAQARVLSTVSSPAGTQAVTVLGVDTGTFAEVVNWRGDYSDFAVGDLVAGVAQPDARGIRLPDDTVMLTARVKPHLRRADVGLTARLRGTSGRYYTLTIGTLVPKSITSAAVERFPCVDPGFDVGDPGDPDDDVPRVPEDWCRIGAPLTVAQIPDDDRAGLSLEFLGISLRPSETRVELGVGTVAISDVSALREDGTLETLTSFGDILETRTPGSTFGALGARIDPMSAGGDDGAILTWSAPSFVQLNGVALGSGERVVKVVASRWFRDELDLQVGSVAELHLGNRDVTAEVVGIVDYFPTFGSADSPFLIADLRSVRDVLVVDDPRASDVVNELWVSLGPDADIEAATAIIGGLREAVTQALSGPPLAQHAAAEQARIDAEPLSVLGWSTFLGIGTVAVAIVAALAFAINGWTTYRLRGLELAVLRSIGMTRRQWAWLITLEMVVPPMVAAAVGIAVGLAISSVLLPYMAGQPVEELAPPMRVQIGWGGFAASLGLIGLALAASIGGVVASTMRQRVDVVLRAGGGVG